MARLSEIISAPLRRFWGWYGRIGAPLSFVTALSPQECRAKLEAQTVPWGRSNLLNMKPYSLQWLDENSFRLRYRRRIQRPFKGQLEPLAGGGTRIRGYVENEASFWIFALVMLIAAPLSGHLVFGGNGLIIGLLIAALLIISALITRLAEEKSRIVDGFKNWLYRVLEAESSILEGQKAAQVSRLSDGS